jgi:hypothetical protein
MRFTKKKRDRMIPIRRQRNGSPKRQPTGAIMRQGLLSVTLLAASAAAQAPADHPPHALGGLHGLKIVATVTTSETPPGAPVKPLPGPGGSEIHFVSGTRTFRLEAFWMPGQLRRDVVWADVNPQKSPVGTIWRTIDVDLLDERSALTDRTCEPDRVYCGGIVDRPELREPNVFAQGIAWDMAYQYGIYPNDGRELDHDSTDANGIRKVTWRRKPRPDHDYVVYQDCYFDTKQNNAMVRLALRDDVRKCDFVTVENSDFQRVGGAMLPKRSVIKGQSYLKGTTTLWNWRTDVVEVLSFEHCPTLTEDDLRIRWPLGSTVLVRNADDGIVEHRVDENDAGKKVYLPSR